MFERQFSKFIVEISKMSSLDSSNSKLGYNTNLCTKCSFLGQLTHRILFVQSIRSLFEFLFDFLFLAISRQVMDINLRHFSWFYYTQRLRSKERRIVKNDRSHRHWLQWKNREKKTKIIYFNGFHRTCTSTSMDSWCLWTIFPTWFVRID